VRRLVPLAAIALAAAGSASGATRLYSSGRLALAVPESTPLLAGIRVPDRGPVSRVAVWVRLDHPRDSDLTLSLSAPSGATVTLAQRRGGSGRNFGVGRGCDGDFAVFTDDAETPVADAPAPFIDGDVRPEQPLRTLRGAEAFGKWVLRVTDTAPGSTGTLRCWKLDLSRDVVETRSAASGPVSARLSFRETNAIYRDVRLRIVRAGRERFAGRVRRVDPCACPLDGPVSTRPLAVRDLDGDREPEVLVDLYSGGAHCCSYTVIYRYRGGRYTTTVAWWGNPGARLVDVDRDGRPEFRTSDDRFAARFVAYAASTEPVKMLRFSHGRLLNVTRSFRRLVEADARAQYRLYLETRRSSVREVRGILAAWLADQYLLGRGAAGWRVLGAAYERGELGRAARKDGYPAGRAYLAGLRAFLRRAGYG
jgi:subtilisin-like proprotein convertase family protein